MKVIQLSLANFHGFDQIDLKFAPNVTVLAGINGVGKSGVLQALATLLSRAMPEFTASSAKPISFADDDIYKDKPLLEVSMIFTVAEQTCDAVIQRVRGADEKADLWNRFWRKTPREAPQKPTARSLATRTRTGDLGAARRETERMLLELKKNPLQPVAMYFSPRRQLPGRPRRIPKPAPFQQRNAYQFALDERDVTVRDFMHWFRWQEVQARRNDLRAKRVLKALQAVVTRFVPEFTDLHIDEEPSLRFVVVKAGLELGLHQLSDGERGLLAIIFDITRRLSIANPNLKDPIKEGSGVVLIDEIELHLHPKWQRSVVNRFRRTFPNVQFILTTHSPFIIQSLKAGELIQLDRKVEPDEYSGKPIEDIVEDVQGVSMPQRSERAEVMEAAATTYFSVLKDRKASKAKLKQAELAYRRATEPYTEHPGLNALLKLEALAATKK